MDLHSVARGLLLSGDNRFKAVNIVSTPLPLSNLECSQAPYP